MLAFTGIFLLPVLEARVRYARVLGIAGLAVIAVSLLWKAPASFVLFVALGPLLILLGVGRSCGRS